MTTESIHITLYHTITSIKTLSLLSTIGNVTCYMLYYKVVVVCQIKEDIISANRYDYFLLWMQYVYNSLIGFRKEMLFILKGNNFT